MHLAFFLRLSFVGASIPLALGGSITTKTGNPLIVYYIAAAMFISAFIYVGFALPESFPEEKRNALSRMRQQPSTHHIITRLASFFRVFEPLKLLVPVRTTSGTRNWRLTWCALHMLVFVTAGSYASSAWLVLATSKYHFTPADVSNSIHVSLCRLIYFTPDWSFPHHRHCQRRDYLGGDCPTARSPFASVLLPKNYTLPSHGRRTRRTRTGNLGSLGCTLGFHVVCYRCNFVLVCGRIQDRSCVDRLYVFSDNRPCCCFTRVIQPAFLSGFPLYTLRRCVAWLQDQWIHSNKVKLVITSVELELTCRML